MLGSEKCEQCGGLRLNHREDRLWGHQFVPDHVRPEIRELIRRGNVTHEEYSLLRINSYERERLIPVLTDDAIIEEAEHILANCFTTPRRPCSTYNEAFEALYGPEIIRRFRRALAERKVAEKTSGQETIEKIKALLLGDFGK